MADSPATLARFEAERPRLHRLAYRMLGSLAEADDVTQDAWLRWVGVEDTVDSPAAYLTRIVTRLCLDRMKSAQARREAYVGQWLPEPLIDAEEDEVAADEVTASLMLALERLSPLERAAFLLHDIFGTPLHEVATAIGREPAAVRQLAVRARRHVQAARPRYRVDGDEAERIARAFFTASREGDMTALRAMLAEDVVVHADGGGRVVAARNPVRGLERVLRFFAGLKRKYGALPAPLIQPVRIDGLPGYVTFDQGEILQTTAVAIDDGRITAIYIMRNPDKLRHVARALNLR